MLLLSTNTTLILLILLSSILLILLNFLLNKKKRKQLDNIFITSIGIMIFWLICCILQIVFMNHFKVNPLIFEYFIYIGVCFLPVAFFFIALIFVKTKIKLKKEYILLFIIPIASLIILWTNNYHHLFYILKLTC